MSGSEETGGEWLSPGRLMIDPPGPGLSSQESKARVLAFRRVSRPLPAPPCTLAAPPEAPARLAGDLAGGGEPSHRFGWPVVA